MKKKVKPKKQVKRGKKQINDMILPKLESRRESEEPEDVESIEELAEREGAFEDDSENLEEDRY